MKRAFRSIAVLILLLAAASSRAQDDPPAAVVVASAVRRSFADTVRLLAEVEPLRQGRVSAEVDGLVETLDVVEGQSVAATDVVVRLGAELLRIRERRAAAELELATKQLEEYEAGSRPEDVAEARAEVAEAEAQLTRATDDLSRIADLVAKGAVRREELTKARADELAARSVLAAKRAVLERVEAGPRAEQIARAGAEVATRQAALDEIADEIIRTEIRPPFAGVITRKVVDRGHFVRRGDAVLEIVQLDPVRVSVPVPEALVPRVTVGATMTVRFDALGDEAFEAKVEAIVPVADRAARMFPVKLLLPNPEHRILTGMVARVDVPRGGSHEGTAVPREAIVRGPHGASVFVVRDGHATPAPIEIGASDGRWVELRGDSVAAGDSVVVRGNERLRPDQPVRIVPSVDAGANVR